MRPTILIALLALAACSKPEAQPRPAASSDRGFIQEVDGHRFAVVMQGEAALVIPLDDVPPGTMLATDVRGTKIGAVAPLKSIKDLPFHALCPCCAQRCGSGCDDGLIGVGCVPGLDLAAILDRVGKGRSDPGDPLDPR